MLSEILERLENTRQWKGQWIASCPAHKDKEPSLRIKQLEDGRILLKCWAGCHARAITNAVGLDMRVLYPQSPASQKPKHTPGWIKAKQAAEQQQARLKIAMFNADFKNGRKERLTPANMARYLKAYDQLRGNS